MAKCFGVSVYLEGMPLLAVQGTTRILVFGVNKDAYASSYLLQGVAEICSMIRGLDDWLGWACSFPATGPGPGWCLDTEVGAVMVFFSSTSAKVSKKGNISSAAQSCAHGQT